MGWWTSITRYRRFTGRSWCRPRWEVIISIMQRRTSLVSEERLLNVFNLLSEWIYLFSHWVFKFVPRSLNILDAPLFNHSFKVSYRSGVHSCMNADWIISGKIQVVMLLHLFMSGHQCRLKLDAVPNHYIARLFAFRLRNAHWLSHDTGARSLDQLLKILMIIISPRPSECVSRGCTPRLFSIFHEGKSLRQGEIRPFLVDRIWPEVQLVSFVCDLHRVVILGSLLDWVSEIKQCRPHY